MELSDYAQALGAAQRLVPNWREGDMQEAQLATARMQPQLIQAQTNRFQAQAQQEAVQAQQAAQYQSDLGTFKRTPQGYRDMAIKYPQFGEHLENAAKGLDVANRQKLVQKLAPIQSLISSGRYDTAAQEIKRHIDADVAAGGEPDESDQELYDELTSGDPARQKAAGGMAFGLLSAMNPDTAAANLNKRDENAGGQYTLAPGSKRFDANGKLLASADFAPDRFTLSPGETRYDSNSGGGDPASSGGAAGGSSAAPAGRTRGGWTPRARNGGDNDDAAVDGKITGMARALGVDPSAPFPPGTTNMQIAQALTLSEGGKGSIADRNNNPGNLTDPKTGGYRKFATKEAGLQAAAAQVARNRARGQNTIQSMVEGLPVGGAGSSAAAPAAGGARVVAQAAPKPGYRILSPDETSAQGLDPNVKYQTGPDGQITALGGQNKAQLKPIPAAAASALVTNNSSIANIDSAIKLLDPKNKSNEAQQARYAIGTTNRFLPDAVLQNTNPGGVSFRAQIGQLGGLIVKDVSGAAVSASEDDRLAKWVPMVTDTPSAALAKLKNLRRELANKNLTISQTYGEDQGYRQPASLSGGGGNIATVRSVQQAQRLAPGTLYRAPDGKVRRR